MSIIKKLLNRGDSKNKIFDHYRMEVFEENGDIKFCPEGDEWFTLSLTNGEKYDIGSELEFSKEYLENNNAVIEDSLGRVVMNFSNERSEGVVWFKLRKEQLSNFNGILINGENYCEKGNFSVSRTEKDKFLLGISDFPKGASSVEISFDSTRPSIEIKNCDLENVNEVVDLTTVYNNHIHLTISSRISGRLCLDHKSYKISEVKETIYQTDIGTNKIRLSNISNLQEEIQERKNRSLSITILPDNYAPMNKKVTFSDTTEVTITPSDLDDLATLTLRIPEYLGVNPKLRYSNRYNSDDEFPKGRIKKYGEYEKDGDKIIFRKIWPGEEINIHYESNSFEEVITRINPLKPGENKEVRPELTLKRKKLTVISKSEKSIIKINGETKQISGEETFEVKVKDQNDITVKNTSGEELYSKLLNKEKISKIKNIEVSKGKVAINKYN